MAQPKTTELGTPADLVTRATEHVTAMYLNIQRLLDENASELDEGIQHEKYLRGVAPALMNLSDATQDHELLDLWQECYTKLNEVTATLERLRRDRAVLIHQLEALEEHAPNLKPKKPNAIVTTDAILPTFRGSK